MSENNGWHGCFIYWNSWCRRFVIISYITTTINISRPSTLTATATTAALPRSGAAVVGGVERGVRKHRRWTGNNLCTLAQRHLRNASVCWNEDECDVYNKVNMKCKLRFPSFLRHADKLSFFAISAFINLLVKHYILKPVKYKTELHLA